MRWNPLAIGVITLMTLGCICPNGFGQGPGSGNNQRQQGQPRSQQQGQPRSQQQGQPRSQQQGQQKMQQQFPAHHFLHDVSLLLLFPFVIAAVTILP